jgi:hypothetical protein
MRVIVVVVVGRFDGTRVTRGTCRNTLAGRRSTNAVRARYLHAVSMVSKSLAGSTVPEEPSKPATQAPSRVLPVVESESCSDDGETEDAGRVATKSRTALPASVNVDEAGDSSGDSDGSDVSWSAAAAAGSSSHAAASSEASSAVESSSQAGVEDHAGHKPKRYRGLYDVVHARARSSVTSGVVIDDVSELSTPCTNHVVICGLGDVSMPVLERLLRVMRASSLPVMPTIVVLQPLPPDRRNLERLIVLKDVFVVQVRGWSERGRGRVCAAALIV